METKTFAAVAASIASVVAFGDGGALAPPDFGPAPYFADYAVETPVVNVPRGCRTANWTERISGEGSCVHASVAMLMEWQGQSDLAEWWRRNHSGGETPSTVGSQLTEAGIEYAVTTDGDVEFLEWAIRTRRGASVAFKPRHMVCLVHLDETHAGILDSNNHEEIEWYGRDDFITGWRGDYGGGWAVTTILDPPPPLPTQLTEE